MPMQVLTTTKVTEVQPDQPKKRPPWATIILIGLGGLAAYLIYTQYLSGNQQQTTLTLQGGDTTGGSGGSSSGGTTTTSPGASSAAQNNNPNTPWTGNDYSSTETPASVQAQHDAMVNTAAYKAGAKAKAGIRYGYSSTEDSLSASESSILFRSPVSSPMVSVGVGKTQAPAMPQIILPEGTMEATRQATGARGSKPI